MARMQRKRAPEAFLAAAKAEEKTVQGGRLKVFLGAAPGVGKTFAMLQAARMKKGEGVDVLVGLVETHGRAETQALLEGLETLPRKTVEYRGLRLNEFDLDATLARQPDLVLVDELAHTNAPGLRHAKRWQDVLELLERGMDVYATLNIQHLETLNDVVAQITGIKVRETVPDSVLERAEVELVDLPPGELLERLKQGKVYFPEQAARATENFFKLSNLNALRELALRATAEGVGAQVEQQRVLQAPEATWPTVEKLLVCVGPNPNSAKLVRAAKRMAVSLKTGWMAVFVDAADKRLSESERASAVDNLRLAERLGGETLTISAANVPEGVLDLARQRNVTKIILGKEIRPRWREFLGSSLVDDVIRASGDIDVDVITGEQGEPVAPSSPPPTAHAPPGEYALAGGAIALCTALCFGMFPFLAPTNLVMVYLLGTMAVAMRGHQGPAVLASIASVLCFAFFFVPPRFTFAVSDTQYSMTFIVMAAAAVIISHLTVRIRSQAETARLNEMRTATMHALSRQLATTRGMQAILEVAVHHMALVFDSEVIALLPGKEGPLEVKALSGEKRELDEKERSVAQWVFDLGQSAGLGTQTLPIVDALYAPLIGGEGSVGVLRVQPKVRERLLIPDQMLLLESFAHQIALSLEVDRLQENARQAQIHAEAERLRMEPQAIGKIVGGALNRLKKMLAGRQVRADLPEDLPRLPLDAVLMEQVFFNLIENAARHTPPGTPIEISAQVQENSLAVTVADLGPGLSPDITEKVFDRFFRAPTPSAGAGLGLAICKAVIEAHGGRIWAENRPEGGAAFRLTLPLKRAA